MRGLPSEGEDRADAAQTLQLVLAAGLQEQARAVEEVARRAGKEDLAWPGERGYPRRGMNTDARPPTIEKGIADGRGRSDRRGSSSDRGSRASAGMKKTLGASAPSRQGRVSGDGAHMLTY